MPAMILAAALAAATLPPGKGLAFNPAPLSVTSSPPGATVSAQFRDSLGDEHVASCIAPCTLRIPQGSPFLLSVERDGKAAALPLIQWRASMTWRTFKLDPAAITVSLEGPTP